jgi:hypothetical protein
MPNPLDPNETKDVYAKSDEALPVEKRRVFRFRYLSARKYLQLKALRKEAKDATDDADATPKLVKAIGIGLAGWSNVESTDPDVLNEFGATAPGPLPFKPELLDVVLGPQDLWTAAYDWVEAVTLGDDLPNSSSSASPSPAEPSSTPQASPNPSSSPVLAASAVETTQGG